MTRAKLADTAILVEAIANAAELYASLGNVEAALHTTRYAVAVLAVDERVARAWSEMDWSFAAARAASVAVHAVRACAA